MTANPKSTLGRGKSHKCFKIYDEYCRLILHFLGLLAIITHELVPGYRRIIENQPRLKNFNLKLILTCNIYTLQTGATLENFANFCHVEHLHF